MTTLEDLYYGNIVPHEHSFKRGSAYSEVLSYVIRHQDSLIPTLTAQHKKKSLKSSKTARRNCTV